MEYFFAEIFSTEEHIHHEIIATYFFSGNKISQNTCFLQDTCFSRVFILLRCQKREKKKKISRHFQNQLIAMKNPRKNLFDPFVLIIELIRILLSLFKDYIEITHQRKAQNPGHHKILSRK